MRAKIIVVVVGLVAQQALAQKTELATGREALRFEARELRHFAFPGRSGQALTVVVEDLVHASPAESSSHFTVLKPDGSQLGSASCRDGAQAGGPCKLILDPLPVSGQYTVSFWPPERSSASGRIAVNEDVSCVLERRNPTSVKLERPGQVARCVFSARAGESIGFEVGAIKWPAGALRPEVLLNFRDPRGNVYRARKIDPREGDVTIPPRAFTVTGSYSVIIDPGYGTLPSLSIAFTGR